MRLHHRARLVAATTAIAALAAVALATPASPDRWVNCATGNDRGPGIVAAPYRTITKALAAPLPAGTTVWLARGCTWDGQVVVTGGGTATSPVVITAYGTGPAPTLTGVGLGPNQAVVEVDGAYTTVSGVHVSHAAGTGLAFRGLHDTIQNSEIDAVGLGVQFFGAYGSATTTNVHDLHMVVNTVGGSDDYGAVGFDVEATGVEVAHSNCTNCRAPSYDYGYDGGFVEVWNHGDRLYVHDNTGQNTNGILEVGGDDPDGSAYGVVLTRNTFNNTHGGIWIHGQDGFAIPVSGLVVSDNTFTDTPTSSDEVILGGDLSALSFTGNKVLTTGQVSWSGAPAIHACNTYTVAGAWAVGFPPAITETVTAGTTPATLPAGCA